MVVDGERSVPVPVLSGVPQRSFIGPALFLFYITDLPNGSKSKIRFLADDAIIISYHQQQRRLPAAPARLNSSSEVGRIISHAN